MILSEAASAVFDCDGVLIDSNAIKTNVYAEILAPFPPGLRAAFFAHAAEHPGASRHVLFDHFFKEIARAADWRTLAPRAAGVFSDVTRAKLVACEEVPGVRGVLDWLQARGVPCMVVSAADGRDVEWILTERGMAGYFRQICGAPALKGEHLSRLAAEGLLPAPTVFFGDSRADMDAAEAHGCTFVFVAGRSHWTHGADECRRRGHLVIEDFTALPLP